jgi:hypothetical protein
VRDPLLARFMRRGMVLKRPEGGSSVCGDPCIVWDEALGTWRMFLFLQPPGCGQSLCLNPAAPGPGAWEPARPLHFENPQDILGGYVHKPFVVMDPLRPNHAARVGGRFWLLGVACPGGRKVVQQAWAERLEGPWHWEREALIPGGRGADFDARHADAVSGYYFADRGEFLYFYMGYPLLRQPWAQSPFGSAQGLACRKPGEKLRKLGPCLPPSPRPGHWASGWVGGLQLLPGTTTPWIALVNASPTPPLPDNPEGGEAREEPAPSLGGFAVCGSAWPVQDWSFRDQPLEWIEDLPEQALQGGEGVNFWRQHLLGLPGGGLELFYNSGAYGREQIYLKSAEPGNG